MSSCRATNAKASVAAGVFESDGEAIAAIVEEILLSVATIPEEVEARIAAPYIKAEA